MSLDPPSAEVRPGGGSDRPPTIAVDGPSGSGKSTVSRGVANRLGWAYLDTGASYRAVTLAALRAGAVADGRLEADPTRLAALVAETLAIVDLGVDPRRPYVRLGSEDVSEEVRGELVTGSVSAVSAVPAVRELLVGWQRRIAWAGDGCVAEGRDIGTVVLPASLLKVWLTARPEARARRRASESTGTAPIAAVRAGIELRDALDSARAVAPARPADDAVVFDSTDLDAAAVTDGIVGLAEARGLRAMSR